MCLNHKLPGVEGIYDQHTYYDERRGALEKWSDFLTSFTLEGMRKKQTVNGVIMDFPNG